MDDPSTKFERNRLPRKVVIVAASKSPREGTMRETFNVASLAKLSRQELLSLLANYQSKACAAESEVERSHHLSQLALIQAALALK